MANGEAVAATPGYHLVLVNKWFAGANPFTEVIDTLAWGLTELGVTVSTGVNHWRADARQIVLCPHLLDDATLASLAPGTIAYNLEQIDAASQLPTTRLAAFRNLCVWDYSPRNLEHWRAAGIAAAHLPVGWYPGLERVGSAAEQDVDVLFYGILNDRRKAALERIGARGLRVAAIHMLFGRERDAWIARAKVVLNLHFYPAAIFESVRAAYLLANGKALVSERAANGEVPAEYEDAVAWSAYDDLADRCRAVIDDGELRTRLEAAGPAAMRKLTIVPLLRQALARSGAPG